MACMHRALIAGVTAWLLSMCSGPGLEPLPAVGREVVGPALAERLDPLVGRLRSEPDDAEAAGRAGMLLQAHDQHGLALGFLSRASALQPEELRWAYYLGISLARLGRHREAAAWLQRCTEIDERFGPAWRRLAEATFDAGDLPASLAAYSRLRERAPDDPLVLYGLGRARAAVDQPEAAIEHLKRAVELSPEFGAAHLALAGAYRSQGLTAEARRHLDLFERHRNRAPDRQDALTRAVSALRVSAAELLRRGVEAKEDGRSEAAVRLHLQALDEDPSLTQARTNLVILYGTLGRAEDAAVQYRLALEGGSPSAELHYNYGVVAYRRGQPGEARKCFLQALALNPDHALANHNLGQMLEEEGRLEEAMARYRRALANRPDHALSHYKIGMLWARRHRAPEAVRAFREAAREQSDRTPTYLFSLGGALLASGDRVGARSTFRDARSQAARYAQADLVARIDEALRAIEGPPATR